VAAACSGSLYSSHASASPLVGGFTSSSVTQTPVGTVSFTFLDDNTATLSYTVNGVRVTKTIARNVFGGILGRKLSPAQAGEIDVDGTGKAQILVRSADARLMLGRLVNGQFQFSTTQDPGAKFRVVGVTDIDGDGKSDLVFQDTTQGVFGDVRAWSAFNPATDRLLRQVKLDWHVEGTGDLDGDGFGDLLWRWRGDDGIPNDTGVSYAWFTNGAGVDQVKKRGGAPLSWQLLGATDINGDGAADMLYLSPDGQLRALLDTGAGGRSCANVVIGSVPAGYAAIKYADFTGASRGDVLVKNAAGQVQLLSIDASAVHPPAIMTDMNSSCVSSSTPVTLTALPIGSVDPTWTFYAAGDYNGDGIRDIVWQQPNGTLTVWLLASNGQAPIVISNAGTAPAGFSVFQP
jgi:hypothetical protein